MSAQRRVQALVEGGIKLLALDFDMTVCSIHTRGLFMGTEEDLTSLLHRDMVELIRAAAPKIQIAVTTFSRQTDLIGRVVGQIAPNTIVRGDFHCETINKSIVREGKQTHIHSVLEELAKAGTRLKPEQVLLVDDQESNVFHAVENGSYGLVFHSVNCLSALDRPFPASKPSYLNCVCHTPMH